MSLGEQIQKFLEKEFAKHSREQFIKDVGFSRSAIGKILNAEHRNPEFKTILKIADYFNCSIDKIINRNKYKTIKYKSFNLISLEEINKSLQIFLKNKINEFKYNPYKLGKDLGFNEHIVVHFLKGKKNLGSPVVIALADYFKISIDEMIGRVSKSQEPQNLGEFEPKEE